MAHPWSLASAGLVLTSTRAPLRRLSTITLRIPSCCPVITVIPLILRQSLRNSPGARWPLRSMDLSLPAIQTVFTLPLIAVSVGH